MEVMTVSDIPISRNGCLPSCSISDQQLSLAPVLAKALESFQNSDITVAFGGHFNAGKSTLINSLTRLSLLPVDYRPETGVACWLMLGTRNRAAVVYEDGSEKEIDCSREGISAISTLIDRVTGEQRMEYARAKAIKVWLEIGAISPRVCWLDTPGINDTGDMDERAKTAAAVSDLLLWVMNSQAVLSEVEQRFLADHATSHGASSIVFVLNAFLKSDSRQEWDEYITEYHPINLKKIQNFMKAVDPSHTPLVIPVAARAMATQPADFNAEQLRDFVSGNAEFTERLWMSRGQRLAIALRSHEDKVREGGQGRKETLARMRAEHEALAAPHLASAWKAFDRKQYKEMLLQAGAASDCAPWMVEPLLARSVALLSDRQFDCAQIAAARALRLDPESPEVRFVRAWVLSDSGTQLNVARSALDAVLASHGCRGWMKTVAAWLRAKAAASSNPAGAARDLLAAAEDVLGLARISLTPAALFFAAAHQLEASCQFKEAISSYGRAMKSISNHSEADVAASFATVIQSFSIKCADATAMFLTARKLWDTCQRAHGGATHNAATAFWEEILTLSIPEDVKTVDPALFADSQDFFVQSTSFFARSGDGSSFLALLQALLSLHPNFNIRRIKDDPFVSVCQDATVCQALTAQFSCEYKAGAVINNVQIVNKSLFRLTDIQLQVSVTRTVGTADAPFKLTAPEVGPNQTLTWNNVLKDAGLFGNKIKGVFVILSCAESLSVRLL